MEVEEEVVHLVHAEEPMFIPIFFLTVGYFLAKLERPVLGLIEADVCK